MATNGNKATTEKKSKEGGPSRISQFREALEKEGLDKATEFGLELGLSQATINTQTYKWRRETGQPKPERAPRAAPKPKAKVAADPKVEGAAGLPATERKLSRISRKTKDKPKVRVTYIADRVAYLVEEGPQQSEICWAHNGNHVFVCNEHLEKLAAD